jgi:hypothetical protein
MKIKVGSIKFKNGNRVYPTVPDGYKVIEVMTKCSKYSDLSPYCLENEKGELMENIWQFSKIYKEIPKQSIKYSNWDNRIIWKHVGESHINENDDITEKYWEWREKGFKCKDAIRYPVGFKNRSKCVGAILSRNTMRVRLNYIDSRKQIYLPVYTNLVKNKESFKKLKDSNDNLFIIEVDGPKSESNEYYKNKYGIDMGISSNNDIDVSHKKISILLNDEKHPFGHGFCLAMALLDMDYSNM